jgi:hypothetical protein
MPTTTASTKISKMPTTATYVIAGQVPSPSSYNRYIAGACGPVPDPDVAISTQVGSNLIDKVRRRRTAAWTGGRRPLVDTQDERADLLREVVADGVESGAVPAGAAVVALGLEDLSRRRRRVGGQRFRPAELSTGRLHRQRRDVVMRSVAQQPA